jgi:hypothetical protein
MKLKFLLAFCLGVLSFSVSAQAQSDFNSFWTNFKTAVVKVDKNAVAGMTKFPLSMPYGVKSVKTKADFLKRYDKIMNMEANSKRCFQNGNAEKQGNRYEIACNFKSEPESSNDRPIVYYFTKTKTGWKFAGLDNINE